MNKCLIMVVEDDVPVLNLITTTLKANDYRYITASDGKSGMLEAASKNPDIILLDLGLPDMDGVEVIERIRSWSNTPIIVISARSEDADKIDALDAGADDYLTKPFAMKELLARIEAVLRRSDCSGEDTKARRLVFDKLVIDMDAFELIVDGKKVDVLPILPAGSVCKAEVVMG